jgi:hypothetical protein
MDDRRKDHLQMIQGIIYRMAQNSFQLKGWTVTLAAALEVFLRRLFDHVRTENGPPDFSIDVSPFAGEVGPVLAVAMSPTIIGFYGPVLFVAIALAVILPR